jgi:hypothetical protein
MPQQQLFGIIIMGIGIADTAIGHLVVVPRVSDPHKRLILKVAFSISGVMICALGLVVYKGMIPL